MIEQIFWILASCIGCVVGTLLSVWIGRITEKIYEHTKQR
jgi:membrane protein DedA with SNARE-associated domain